MTDSDRLDKIETTLGQLVVGINTLSTSFEHLSKDVEHLSKDVEHLSKDVEHLSKDVEVLKQETSKTNDRVEIYQKASQQVVNLAFSLVLTATIAIIVQGIINR